MSVTIIETKSAFDKALLDGGDKLLVIDFYAVWCGPCKVIAPKIQELAEQHNGKVLFYKVDVDENSETAEACGISAMPTFQFYKNGQKIAFFKGANEAMLVQTINENS